MSEAMIDDLLDSLVPAVDQLPDWDGVRRRVKKAHRRRVVLAALVLALVVIPAAYAVARAFEGTPGPPQIREFFRRGNRLASMANAYAARRGFHLHARHALASTAHGVLQVRTSDGLLDLWAARSDEGGICWFFDFEADIKPAGPPTGGGGCDSGRIPVSKLDYSLEWTRAHPTLQTLVGRVYVPASTVRIALSNGSEIRLPVVEGLYFGAVPDHTRVRGAVAFDARGRRVAAFDVPG